MDQASKVIAGAIQIMIKRGKYLTAIFTCKKHNLCHREERLLRRGDLTLTMEEIAGKRSSTSPREKTPVVRNDTKL